MHQFLPKTVIAKQGVEFNTISMIIRHTQKKPRQFIHLYNCIYACAKENNVDFSKQVPSDIVNVGIHKDLNSLVEGALNIYSKIWKDISYSAKRVLTNLSSVFSYSEIMSRMNEINNEIAEANYLDENFTKDIALKILLNTGVIGIVSRKQEIYGNNGIKVRMLDCVFEYQLKNQLEPTNDTIFVIHPMAFHYFNTNIDRKDNEFIYPHPVEKEESDAYQNFFTEI